MSSEAPRARMRLMPVVMTAAAALLALKVVGLATQTSYLFVPEARASTAPKPSQPAAAADPAAATPPDPAPRPAPPVDASPSERALLEALQKRREAMDGRANDLELRENLLKAAEQRMEERLDELKRLEQSLAEADKRREETEKTKLKELIAMYEGMKVKEAARIFDRLESSVLLDVASRMSPRKMSDILGQMSPDVAQKLTVALARRDTGAPRPATLATGDLPKIEGRPAPY